MPVSKRPKLRMVNGGLKARKLNIRQPDIGLDLAKAQQQAMRAIALGLDEAFNGDMRADQRQVGFCLLVFPFHSPTGECNCITNGSWKIEDMKKFFTYQLARIQMEEMEEETKDADGN